MYALLVLLCIPTTMHAGKVVCSEGDWNRVAGYQTMEACKWAADSIAVRHRALARCEARPDYVGDKLKD